MDYPGLVRFYAASLPIPYQNMTSKTIMAIAASTRNYSTPAKPVATPVIPLTLPYATLALQAATACAMEACQSLGYTGNIDPGGAGVYIICANYE